MSLDPRIAAIAALTPELDYDQITPEELRSYVEEFTAPFERPGPAVPGRAAFSQAGG